MTVLGEIASVRSKNADPFITTCDIFVATQSDYDWIKGSGILTPRRVAELYGMPVDAVLGVFFVDNINAVKVSFLKTSRGHYVASGDLEDPDVMATQQHVPLLRLELPLRRL
jgi:hypothetical protein